MADFRIIRLHGIAASMREGPVGLPNSFRIVIGLWISPPISKVEHIGISVARQARRR